MKLNRILKKFVQTSCALLLSLGLFQVGVGSENMITDVHASNAGITGEQLFSVANEALYFMQTNGGNSPYVYYGSCTGGLANMLHAVDQVYGTDLSDKIAYNVVSDNVFTTIQDTTVGFAAGGFYSKYATYQIRENLDEMVSRGEAELVAICTSDTEANASGAKSGDLFVLDVINEEEKSSTGHVGIIKREDGVVYTGNLGLNLYGMYAVPSAFVEKDIEKSHWPMWIYRVTTEQRDLTVNMNKSSASISITNDNQQYSLLGAVYGVYSDSDCKTEVGTITTNADGKGSFTSKFPNETTSLYVKEKVAPNGYSLDEEVYKASFDGTDSYTVNSSEKPNTNLFSIQVHKKASDIVGGEIPSLAGAQYTIRYYDQQYENVNQIASEPKRSWVIETKDEQGEAIARIGDEWKVAGDEFYHNSDGDIVIPLGTITIEETKAPDGYAINGATYVTTDSDNNETLRDDKLLLLNITKRNNEIVFMSENEIIQNEKSFRGGFEVQKFDHDFGKGTSGNSEDLITGISIKNTNPYDVKLFNANDETVAFASANSFFLNEDGSHYQFQTNEDGNLITNQNALPTGTYELYEETAPTGYVKKEDAFGVITIQEDGTYTRFVDGQLTNDQIHGGFEIQKEDSEDGTDSQGDTNLKTVFELYNRSLHGVVVDGTLYEKDALIKTITTDKSGYYASSPDYLPYGSYELIETIPPEGYTGEDGEGNLTRSSFTIQDESKIVTTTSFVNHVITGSFSIHKTYSSQNVSSFAQNEAGATFVALLKSKIQDTNKDGKISAVEVREQYADLSSFQVFEQAKLVTDLNGKATSSPLAFGTYVIAQLSSPNDEIQMIEDTVEFKVSKQDQPIVEYEASNHDQPYWLEIQKKDVQTGEIVTYNSAEFKVFQLTDSSGNPVNEYVRQKVNAKYYDTFRTISMNGTQDQIGSSTFIPSISDDEIEQVAGGVIAPLSLYPGTYRLEEIKAPAGFTMMDPITFEVHHGGIHDKDEDGQPIIQVVAQNVQVTGSLEIQKKVIDYAADTTLIHRNDLSDISFELIANEDIIDVDHGSILTQKGEVAHDIYGNVVGSFSLDSNGKYSLKNLPLGSYTLKEIHVPNGMIRNEQEIEVVFTQEDTVQEVYDVAKEVVNDTTKVSLSKKSVTSQDELPGATLSIYDSEKNCIDTWVSGDHPHTIEGLTVGQTYEMVEEIAVDQYVQATSILFTIQNDGNVQSVTMIDQQVTFVKEDGEGNHLSGATISIVDSNGNEVDTIETSDQVQYINQLKAGETYTAIETNVPNGYYVAENQTFTVNNQNANQEVKMIDQKIRYAIEKIDDFGKPVDGVTLKLYDVTNHDTEIPLPNSGITTVEPFVLEGILCAGHQYRLVEEEYVAGVYKATDILFQVPTHGTDELVTITMEDVTTSVSVAKVDAQQRAISGAHLQIIEAQKDGDDIVAKKNENGEVIVVKDFVSSDTTIDVSDCVKGDEWYFLQEVEAPYGYELADPIPFMVSGKQDQCQVIRMCDEAKSYQVNVHKIAKENKQALAGAEFALFDSKGNVVKDMNGNTCKGVTNDEGNISWNVLYTQDASGYYVQETTAPVGYTCCEDQVLLSFDTTKEFINEPIVMTIEDTEEPRTGVSSTQMLWITLCSILGLANFLYLGLKK